MADATISKRLIISGLTPEITLDGIKGRLSSFGSVTAVDGFGLLDRLGQPRKFAYVTLETTQSKLGKCMSVLSGSVWKGTKLRLGEAKPDYRERIARENLDAMEKPLKKRQRFDAVHAADMSLVTTENAGQRPGWQVSPLGRITHPLKIRPIRPLTHLQHEKSRSTSILKNTLLKKKKEKIADTRTRKRTIDMTRWGSTHLKGSFLNSVSLPVLTGKPVDDVEAEDYSNDEGGTSCTTVDGEATALPIEELPRSGLLLQSTVSQIQSDSGLPTQFDMEREKGQTLDFLSSLFGGSKDEDDWIGRESVGSDVEMEELAKEVFSHNIDDHTLEEVPRTPGKDQPNPQTIHKVDSNKSLSKSQSVVDSPTTNVTVEPNTATKLKDLFAPREEAAFSLLDHLDLDIALNEDVSFLDEPMSTDLVAPHEPSHKRQVWPTDLTSHVQSSPCIVLNPKRALFFPFPASELKEANRARQRDPYDLIRENGWYWRDPAVRFWNSESEEEIRKKWEASRGDLTKSWKQVWKDAGKVRRRQKLGDGDEQM